VICGIDGGFLGLAGVRGAEEEMIVVERDRSDKPVEEDIGERKDRMADRYLRKTEVIQMTARCWWREKTQRVRSTRLILPDADASF
jgi:hypothetical protein